MNRCTRICAMNDPDKGCLLGLGDNCTVGPDKGYQRPAEVESGSVREKLVELINDCRAMEGYGMDLVEKQADHLIANGVTIQEWVPVTERLPDTIPCGAGTAYSEAVNILTAGRKVLTAIWDGTDFIADAKFWEAEGEKITHWTPVLLPLPPVPKGE